ncbi:hypothetical protein [Amedibacillus dolichus]|uniref:hypothetical protein n=1 Tax=Amedibacillus dolichus TaxID=31971 RepID=UPI0039A0FF4A
MKKRIVHIVWVAFIFVEGLIVCETSIKALENNKADYANTVCCDRTSSSDDECSCYGFDHDRE